MLQAATAPADSQCSYRRSVSRVGLRGSDSRGKRERVLLPSHDAEVWIPCGPDQVMNLDPERPNLLATVSLEDVRGRGLRVVTDG